MSGILLPTLIVAGIGILMGIVLVIAAKFMAVPVDERVTQVREVLPGANCGACGFAGCDEYAEKLVGEGVAANLCTPGGGAVASKIGELLGVDAGAVVAIKAIVKCSGTCEKTTKVMEYKGQPTCEACNYFFQGHGSCSHACLGFGDCVGVCAYDAIHIANGIAVVDREKCTGCGMCSKKCPNVLIDMVPATSEVFVACSSTDKGAFTRKVCSAGCIGCKKCEKTCEYGAIAITDNLARIDPDKCVNCGACVGVCPTAVIKSYLPVSGEESA